MRAPALAQPLWVPTSDTRFFSAKSTIRVRCVTVTAVLMINNACGWLRDTSPSALSNPVRSRKLDQDQSQPEQSRSSFGFLDLDLPRDVSKNGETDQLRDDFLEQIEALAR